MSRLLLAVVSAIVVCILASQGQAQTGKSWSGASDYQKFLADSERLVDAQEEKLQLADEERDRLKSEVASSDAKLIDALGELEGDQAFDVRLRIALARARIKYTSALPLMDEMSEELAKVGGESFFGRAADVRATAARIYLEESLPWKATELLPQPLPMTTPVEAKRVASQIELLFKTLDDDAPRGQCARQDPSSGLCRKLSHLLAVPPWQAGNYIDIQKTSRDPMTDADWSPAQANSISLLSFITQSTRPSNKDDKVVAEPMLSRRAPPSLQQAIAKLAGAPSSKLLQEQVIDTLRADDNFTKYLPKSKPSVDASRKDQAIDEEGDAGSSQVADVRRQGTATVVVIRTFREFEVGYIILRMNDNARDRMSYWHSSGYGSMKHAFMQVGKLPLPALVLSQAVGTGHLLSLSIFDPSAARVLQFYRHGNDEEVLGVYHGAFQFIDFDFDSQPELQITYATGDRRYEECNQCPTRRASEIWRLAPDLSEAQVMGRNVSWADFSVATTRTLTGLGPEIYVSPQVTALDNALKQFADLQLPLAELRSHVEKMNNAVAAYVEIGDWANAAKACLSIARAVAGHSQADALQDLRGVALFNGMYATLRDGRLDDAALLVDEIDRSGIAFQAETRDRIDLVRFDIASQHGDLKTQYQLLERFNALTRLQDEAAYREIAYLLEIGDNAGAVAAAQRAAALKDFSRSNVRQEITWERAVALSNLGRNSDALDQLLVLARDAADSRAGEMLSKVFLLGAKIAFAERELEVGRHLLDASVSHMPADFWKSQASLILSLYATYHQGRGQNREARLFLDRAVAAAQLLGGVRLAVPYDRLAQIAESENDTEAAATAAMTSLRALLGEQGQVVSEKHKLSFVASADQIAASQLARLIRIEADTPVQFAAIEVMAFAGPAVDHSRRESFRDQLIRSLLDHRADPGAASRSHGARVLLDGIPGRAGLCRRQGRTAKGPVARHAR